MNGCIFCELDKSIFYNTIIEETKYFYVIPALGALVEGYVIIVSKEHVNSMIELDNYILKEYDSLLKKYRSQFKEFYRKYPIVFEHGNPDISDFCSSCVDHAHAHIVNHNFKNEDDVLKKLNLQRIDNINNIIDRNYIFYQNHLGENYITYNFKPVKQMMRREIAKDLGIEEMYNWRQYPFNENMRKTIEKFGENLDGK